MPFNRLNAIGQWLRKRAENISALLILTMFTCFIIQIVFRYFFNYPVGWTEEVSVLCWIWVVLWTAAFVISEKDEVRFDILYSQVSERTRRVFTVLTGTVLILLYAVSLPATYSYVAFMKVEHSAYLRIPMNYLYSIYVIFAVTSICRYCALVWRAIHGDVSPMTDPAQLSD